MTCCNDMCHRYVSLYLFKANEMLSEHLFAESLLKLYVWTVDKIFLKWKWLIFNFLMYYFKGGVSLKIFFLHLWTDFDEILVPYVKLRKNAIGVEFFKIPPLVFEILAFFWRKIDFLPKNSQILGTFSQTTSVCRIILIAPSCSSDQYKTTLGSFFWISISNFFYRPLCLKLDQFTRKG